MMCHYLYPLPPISSRQKLKDPNNNISLCWACVSTYSTQKSQYLGPTTELNTRMSANNSVSLLCKTLSQ